MKLEAATRLVAALAEDKPMTLQTVIDALAHHDIRASFPDKAGNSIVVMADGNSVLRAMSRDGWQIVSKRLVDGGLYCSGTSTILEFNDQSLKLLATSPNRVTLWRN